MSSRFSYISNLQTNTNTSIVTAFIDIYSTCKSSWVTRPVRTSLGSMSIVLVYPLRLFDHRTVLLSVRQLPSLLAFRRILRPRKQWLNLPKQCSPRNVRRKHLFTSRDHLNENSTCSSPNKVDKPSTLLLVTVSVKCIRPTAKLCRKRRRNDKHWLSSHRQSAPRVSESLSSGWLSFFPSGTSKSSDDGDNMVPLINDLHVATDNRKTNFTSYDGLQMFTFTLDDDWACVHFLVEILINPIKFLSAHDVPVFLYSFLQVNSLSITLTAARIRRRTTTTTAKNENIDVSVQQTNKRKKRTYQNDSTQERETLYLSSLFQLILFLRWCPFCPCVCVCVYAWAIERRAKD